MDILNTTALVTGANRGIGLAFVRELLDRGATRVYAGVRRPESLDGLGLDPARVTPLRLDITDPEQIAAAADVARDVTLLINNAGISTYQGLITGDLDKVRLEMDTHYFGTLAMVRAFAPVLAANGGGAILNMLSALSWRTFPGATAYGAAKAAAWSMTDGIRLELAGQGTLVTGLHVGAVDTDMMAGWDIPKVDPAALVRAGLDAIEAGAAEVLADETAAEAKAALAVDPDTRYRELLASIGA
ncbi:MAG: SDR family oxidoreductase [Microbacteriaceae bacterium]|nr:SDR family oxidoreductase [Microbacteriaceae bacterium]MCL2794017.1 SDR family oxidoreductase [Microbacteriaceae bacterium]